MRTATLKHKHLKLDQSKIDFAKQYFGVESEQEAIDKALSVLMAGKKHLPSPMCAYLTIQEDSAHG